MLRSVRLRGGKVNRRRRIHALPLSGRPQGMTGQLAEDDMDKAVTDRIEQQVRKAFPDSAIARVQVLQYGDDPEVEPGQAAVRVFFNWPGRTEGGKASPKTVHQFVTANAAALSVLADELPRVIGWAEFRPEGEARPASAGGLSYRIADRGHPAAAHDEAPEERTPVMVRLGAVDLATVDTLITAGIVNSRARALPLNLRHPGQSPPVPQIRMAQDNNGHNGRVQVSDWLGGWRPSSDPHVRVAGRDGGLVSDCAPFRGLAPAVLRLPVPGTHERLGAQTGSCGCCRWRSRCGALTRGLRRSRSSAGSDHADLRRSCSS